LFQKPSSNASPAVYRGETDDDALRVAAALNTAGFRATVDLLGEHIQTLDEASPHSTSTCACWTRSHSENRFDGLLKLTQFGLKWTRCVLAMVGTIVTRAAA
jgi:hypothetical protein